MTTLVVAPEPVAATAPAPMVHALDERLTYALELRDAAVAAIACGELADAAAAAAGALAALDEIAASGFVRAAVLLTVGQVREAEGAPAAALAVLQEAAALLPPGIDGWDDDAALVWCQVHTKLGDLQRIAGDLDGARVRLTWVLQAATARFGEQDPATVSVLNALGIVGKYAGDHEAAEAHYLRAVRAVVAAAEHDGTDPDPEILAVLYHNLAGNEHARGRAAAGLAWAEQGLALRENAHTCRHPDVARDLAAISALYQQAGRLPEAVVAAERALAIFETELGPDHYEVGMTAANLAVFYGDRGEQDAAVALNERALAILTRALGPDHPEVGLTWHNLGIAQLQAARHDLDPATTARASLEHAHRILRQALPADHPQLAATAEALARLGGPPGPAS